MSTERLFVRPAALSDSGAILDIYSHYITGSTVTFELTVPSQEDFRRRMADIMEDYPFLVCCDGGHIVGYAYAHRHQSREAYRYSAEISVYLRPHYTGLGIGKVLCEAVIELLKRQKVQTLYSAVSLPNEPSCALHEALGFSQVGLWRSTGRKLGQWLDIVWYELVLGDYPEEPEDILPFCGLDKSEVTKLLRTVSERLNEERSAQ